MRVPGLDVPLRSRPWLVFAFTSLVAAAVVLALGGPRRTLRLATWDVARVEPGRPYALDLRDREEALRWKAADGSALSSRADGLRIVPRSSDTALRRRLLVPAGKLGAVALDVPYAARGRWRVYLRVGGVESEEFATDALPEGVATTTMVATFGDGPWWTRDIDGLRVDPPPSEAVSTLRGVTLRAPGSGFEQREGVVRPCTRSRAFRAQLDGVPAHGGVRLAVARTGAAAAGGVVTIEASRGFADGRRRMRLPMPPGREWLIASMRLPAGPQTLSARLEDARGQPLTACFGEPEPALPAGRSPDVLLVSIDTLRADALSDAPALAKLAASGRRFTRAQAASNWTLPGHVSLMTSLPYRVHNTPPPDWDAQAGGAAIREAQATLAAALSAAGYATAATTEGGFVDARFGFSAGFERYAMVAPAPDGDGLDALERHLEFARRFARERSDEAQFLFVHTYVVHDYFTNRRAYHDRLLPADAPYASRGNLLASMSSGTDRPPAAFLRRLYAAGVRQADRFVERLMADWIQARAGRPSLVVVTSDHGEAFGEHGLWMHGSGLFDEELRVPLVAWRSDGRLPPGDDELPASVLDVAPSLLAALGLPVPPEWQGAPDRFLHERAASAREVEARSYLNDQASGRGQILDALLAQDRKYMRADAFDGQTLGERCYDLRRDPGERRDLLPEARCLELAAAHVARLEAGGAGRVLLRAEGPLELGLHGASWRQRGFVALQATRGSAQPLVAGAHARLAAPGALLFYTLAGAARLREIRHGGQAVATDVPLAELTAERWAGGAVTAQGAPSVAPAGPGPSSEALERLRALGYVQ